MDLGWCKILQLAHKYTFSIGLHITRMHCTDLAKFHQLKDKKKIIIFDSKISFFFILYMMT